MRLYVKRLFCVVSVLIAVSLLTPVFAFASVGDTDSSIVDLLLGGLKGLFIPSNSFLSDWQQDISNRFDVKFGGVTSAIGYLNDRFSRLREYRNLPGLFDVAFPRGTFMYGIRFNLLSSGQEVLDWVRFCMTGVFVLFTALACYNKVKKMLGK